MELWPIALTLVLVGYLEAISIGKAIEEKNNIETIDANQELIALGTSNLVGSFFQSYPVTASFFTFGQLAAKWVVRQIFLPWSV